MTVLNNMLTKLYQMCFTQSGVCAKCKKHAVCASCKIKKQHANNSYSRV